MTKRQEPVELIDDVDVYIKGDRLYYVFDAGDSRYRNVKSFGPWLRSLAAYVFKDEWVLKEAYYEYGMHTLKFYHKVVGGDLSFQLMDGQFFVIKIKDGGFDLVREDVFVENYRLFGGGL